MKKIVSSVKEMVRNLLGELTITEITTNQELLVKADEVLKTMSNIRGEGGESWNGCQIRY